MSENEHLPGGNSEEMVSFSMLKNALTPRKLDILRELLSEEEEPLSYEIAETAAAEGSTEESKALGEQAGEREHARDILRARIEKITSRYEGVFASVANDIEIRRRTEERIQSEDLVQEGEKKGGIKKLFQFGRKSEGEAYTRNSYWKNEQGEKQPFTIRYHMEEGKAVPDVYEQEIPGFAEEYYWFDKDNLKDPLDVEMIANSDRGKLTVTFEDGQIHALKVNFYICRFMGDMRGEKKLSHKTMPSVSDLAYNKIYSYSDSSRADLTFKLKAGEDMPKVAIFYFGDGYEWSLEDFEPIKEIFDTIPVQKTSGRK